VILNAHWPSDVVAALALGTLWLVMLPAIVGEPRRPPENAVLGAVTTTPR
jgi:membrane-associated phospholipid phosphatase